MRVVGAQELRIAARVDCSDSDRPVRWGYRQGDVTVVAILRARAVRGRLARVLIDTSTDADPVVVGNRGAGSALKQTLGSVNQRTAGHGTAPSVVDDDRQRVGSGVQHGRLPA